MAIERNNDFHLLLSDDELKLLHLLAEREGLGPADYLRTLIRTTPTTTSLRLAQTAAAVFAARGASGVTIDLAKLLEAQAEAMKLAKFEAELPKRKKAG